MLPLSVVICSYQRAPYLEKALQSLRWQTLPRDRFEVIVIDDGSSDETREVVGRHLTDLPMSYEYQANAGLAAARNRGIELARGEVIFFFDDDDIAAPTLLAEHLRSHRLNPDPRCAVLNYTEWSPELTVTPFMRFITEVGCYLFAYPRIPKGALLDYTYFWGGRSSCKRSMLEQYGMFNPVFRFGCEDIELGYRLSRHGLKVVYNPQAVSFMARSVTLSDFLRRLVRQGHSQYLFSRMHADAEVAAWCEVAGFEDAWLAARSWYDKLVQSAIHLERQTLIRAEVGLEVDARTERLFFQALSILCKLTKIKGIFERAASA